MSNYQLLKVISKNQLCEGAVELVFEIPKDKTSYYQFRAGQYVTIETKINNKDIKRSYSICASPKSNYIKVGVKSISKGIMSNYINNTLKINDVLKVYYPIGNFVVPKEEESKKIMAIAAGSGITPVLSLIYDTLENQRDSQFYLIYSNKLKDSVMFKKELKEIKNNYPDRFNIINIFTRQSNNIDPKDYLLEQRVSENTLLQLIKKIGISENDIDLFFICGPQEMTKEIKDKLQNLGINPKKIKYELFFSKEKTTQKKEVVPSSIKISLDGETSELAYKDTSKNILDCVLEAGIDAPFSCKGAVCCTCKAKVIEGKTVMSKNFALSEDEVKDGFILTCQSKPITSNLTIDYDVI